MSSLRQQNIAAALLACFFVAYIVITLRYGPNARLVPLPIALIGLGCLIAQTLRQNLRREPDEDEFGPLVALTQRRRVRDSAPQRKPLNPREETRRELRALGFVAGFVILILALGPVPAVFLFCAGYLGLTRQFGLARSVVLAAAFSTAIYLLFVVGLQLELYHGMLEPLLGWL